MDYAAIAVAVLSSFASVIAVFVGLSIRAAISPLGIGIQHCTARIEELGRSENRQWEAIRHQGEKIARLEGAAEYDLRDRPSPRP